MLGFNTPIEFACTPLLKFSGKIVIPYILLPLGDDINFNAKDIKKFISQLTKLRIKTENEPKRKLCGDFTVNF